MVDFSQERENEVYNMQGEEENVQFVGIAQQDA